LESGPEGMTGSWPPSSAGQRERRRGQGRRIALDLLPTELWILLTGVLLVMIRLALTGRRRGWRAAAEQAERRGWVVARRDREDLPSRYGLLELMRHGYNRCAWDVIRSAKPRPARAFCYHYETGFGKRHASRDLVVAVVETDADRPGLWIGRGRGIESVGAFARYRPMAGVARSEDGEPFRAYAEAAHRAEGQLEADLQGILQEGDGARTLEIRGPYVALYEDGIGPARSQIDLLGRAEAAADLIGGPSGGLAAVPSSSGGGDRPTG